MDRQPLKIVLSLCFGNMYEHMHKVFLNHNQLYHEKKIYFS
jgi:hypothetical protein